MYGVPIMTILVRKGIGSRLERHDGHEAVLLQDILDLDLRITDATLEGIPDKGIDEHLPGVDDEVAAIGPVERPRLIMVEVRRGDPPICISCSSRPKRLL